MQLKHSRCPIDSQKGAGGAAIYWFSEENSSFRAAPKTGFRVMVELTMCVVSTVD